MRPRSRVTVVALALAGLTSAVTGVTFAGFSSQTDNPGDLVTAAADFRAPTVSATVIGKSSGGVPGYVRQSGTYHVYANVSDAGAPPSGIQSVTADVSSVTGGATSAPLASGAFVAGGVSYNYRSALLTADGSLSEGSKPYSIAAADNASNSGTTAGSVVVDNTAPAGADVQAPNPGAGTVGRAEQGDTLAYTFSEEIEPESILAGWSGSATSVVVRMRNGGLLGLIGDNDDVQVFNASDSTLLPLGTVDLGRQDYVGGLLGGEILSFGATGTASTMVRSGNLITITLGSASGSGSAQTAAGNGTMSWSPAAGATDRAGNAASTAAATESGAADGEF